MKRCLFWFATWIVINFAYYGFCFLYVEFAREEIARLVEYDAELSTWLSITEGKYPGIYFGVSSGLFALLIYGATSLKRRERSCLSCIVLVVAIAIPSIYARLALSAVEELHGFFNQGVRALLVFRWYEPEAGKQQLKDAADFTREELDLALPLLARSVAEGAYTREQIDFIFSHLCRPQFIRTGYRPEMKLPDGTVRFVPDASVAYLRGLFVSIETAKMTWIIAGGAAFMFLFFCGIFVMCFLGRKYN